MRFSRFVDNRVLQACIRPQLPKWCGPVTISEAIQVLLGQYICPHEIARSMKWTSETITKGGLGTTAVTNGLKKCSRGRIGVDILRFQNSQELWSQIKTSMKAGEVLYLHEKGHHVLLLGYIEEPLITPEKFQSGMDCPQTMQRLHRSGPHGPIDEKPGDRSWHRKRHLILKAEHNIKNPETQGIGGIIVERELEGLAKELLENKERLHLVRVFKRD